MSEFSMVWKKVFHAVEKIRKSFPCYGKTAQYFSILWKTFFHSVENSRAPALARDPHGLVSWVNQVRATRPRALLLLALLLLLPLPAHASRTLETFAAPAAWKPFLKSPAAAPAPSGIAFPLPFSQAVDRAAWDKPAALDLSAAVAFELEAACLLPDAIRTLGLYFKSGNGWYVATKPLASPAPHTLVFAKSDFTPEGAPAGWNKIDGIRISPWKGANARDTALVLTRLATVEGAALVVVRGTTSCPDPGARAVAAKTTDRVSRLLVEAGIGHTLATDDDLPKGALKNARAALLPYNPNPTPAQLKALTDFLARGGKLGVFYSAAPALATAMGFKLGPYVKAERPDRWRSIVFDDPGAWLVPPRIWQNSPNLMPALPAGPGSRIIARWDNARGVRQPEPALVASPRGFWMSHVLLSDDLPSKKEMLVSLCAHLDPAVWDPAARRAARDAGRVNDFHSVDHAVAEITRQLPAAARPAETRALLNEALLLTARIQAALAAARPRKPCSSPAASASSSSAPTPPCRSPAPANSSASGTTTAPATSPATGPPPPPTSPPTASTPSSPIPSGAAAPTIPPSTSPPPTPSASTATRSPPASPPPRRGKCSTTSGWSSGNSTAPRPTSPSA
jgi:hypothetical protein